MREGHAVECRIVGGGERREERAARRLQLRECRVGIERARGMHPLGRFYFGGALADPADCLRSEYGRL